MKTILFVVAFLSLVSCGGRQVKNCDTFNELPDPTSDTLSDWSGVAAGMNVAYGSIDLRYRKSVAPDTATISKDAPKLAGWRGERISAQVVVWTIDSLKQLECEFSKFTSLDGSLPSSIAQARFVRYVMTDVFEPGCGYRKPEDFPSSLSADMLDTIPCMNVEPKTVRPIWVSIDIPADAKPGYYQGTLSVLARDNKTVKLPITFTVVDRLLPPPSEWAYHLDLWQHPSAVARVQNLKVWSDEHFAAMKPLMKMLADAGQKVITATLNKDPWNGQSFDRYEDMITWTKNADNSWSYDYTVFDRWVQYMMDLGVKKSINCYSMAPWNNELHYMDAGKGDMVTVKADPGSKEFEEMWTPFLLDFVKHLQTKGWLKITNIAMDERSPEVMKATLAVLQKVAPDLGIALADNHESYKRYPFINDMCVSAGSVVDAADLSQRKEKGFTTTYYVCCSHSFPNVFTFSKPSEAVYSAWYAYANGFDGYLRWAYNSWVELPELDSRFRTWPAGDTYIVYPGARSSIRFERLREGIQDVEKVRLLRSELSANPDGKELLNTLEFQLEQFHKMDTTRYLEGLNFCKEMTNWMN